MATDGNYGFWTFNNRNGLAGYASTFETLKDGRVVTVKDPENPAVLEDEFIAYCLRTSRIARVTFCRLFPNLLPGEQERLATLIAQNPRATSLLIDSQEFLDAVQNDAVTSGVRTRLATRVPQIAAENHLRGST